MPAVGLSCRLAPPQDQVCATMGLFGSPSTVAVACSLFALLLVNALCYVFLLQVVYQIMLQVW